MLFAGKTEEAIADLERILSANPGSFHAAAALGYAHLRLRRYDEGVRYLKAALAQDPENKSLKIDIDQALADAAQTVAEKSSGQSVVSPRK